jgi:hypothetical protein
VTEFIASAAMDGSLIDLWRARAEEARTQAAQMEDGSLSGTATFGRGYLSEARRARGSRHKVQFQMPPLKPPGEPSMAVARMRG